MNKGLLVDAFGVPYDDPWDFSASKTHSTVVRTTFDPPPFSRAAGEHTTMFEQVKTYMDTSDYAQRAIAHQQKIAEAQKKLAQQVQLSQTQTTTERQLRWGL